MIIIGSGSREWKDYKPIAKVMRAVINRYGANQFMYYHGNAKGFDKLSSMQLGLLKHKSITAFDADWNTYSDDAGMIRNKQMLDTALKFDTNILLIAMPLENSIGTYGMINICKAAKIQIEIYNPDGELQ
jgi:hypothetical protein